MSQINKVTGLKVCSKCKIEQKADRFGRNRCTADGYDNYCRECRGKVSRLTIQKNIQKNTGTKPESNDDFLNEFLKEY